MSFTQQFATDASALADTFSQMTPPLAEPKKKVKVKKTKASAQPTASPNICKPVKGQKRTFENLDISDADKADRFKAGDVCGRCGHTFSRGMVKKYHYASKNCKEGKPYSATEIGRKGKEGQHAQRKVKKALGSEYDELEKSLKSLTDYLNSPFSDVYQDAPFMSEIDYSEWSTVIDFTNWAMTNKGQVASDLVYELAHNGAGRDNAIGKALMTLMTKIDITIERSATKITFGGQTIITGGMELPQTTSIWDYYSTFQHKN